MILMVAGANIRIRQEIQCLPYAGFIFILFNHQFIHRLPISHKWQPINEDIRWTREICGLEKNQ